MSRADRWWRPTNRRPGVRARSRIYRFNEYDVNLAYDRGVMRGTKDTAERHKRLTDGLQRLNDAIRASEEGDPRPLEDLARELDQDDDDIDGLAREVGVLSDEEDQALWDSVPPHGSGMVVEIEQWLRDRDRWREDDQE